MIGVDVQRIRRALGLRSEPQPELPAGRSPPRGPAARCPAAIRGAAATRARTRSDRAHRQPAPRAAAGRARSRAAVGTAAGPGGGASRRGPAAPATGHTGSAGTRAPPPRARGRQAHDARLAADRRGAGRAQVPATPAAPPGDIRAVRRLDERDLGVGVLPVGAARAARLVPPDALVRVHRADQRGHRHLRTRARLPRRQRADLRRRGRGGHLRIHRLRAGVVGVPRAGARTICTRARR